MSNLNTPWEQIPLSFQFPYACVWFVRPDWYIDGYYLDYGSFTLLNEDAFKSKIPFTSVTSLFSTPPI